jgi:CheY-like chemotaxis protein
VSETAASAKLAEIGDNRVIGVESTETAAPTLLPARPVILVVDDEILLRTMAAEYLRDRGFRVLEAANGDEAVTVLTTPAVIDLVFSDVQMPGEIDGYALAQWVRANRSGIPVLLTSGYHGNRADGDWPLLVKPYDYEVLLQRIRQLTNRSNGV